jgi:hypothetical protein
MNSKPTCYVFGYGSLMYPSGINGRGMKHNYVWPDLCLASISKYRRGMYSGYSDLLYYGLLPDESAHSTLGVIVPIFSEDDFTALKHSEGVSSKYEEPMYEMTDVTNLVHLNVQWNNTIKPVYAFTNKHDKSINGGHPLPWYVANVWCGIQPWGYYNVKAMENTGILVPTKFWKVFKGYYTLRKKARRLLM